MAFLPNDPVAGVGGSLSGRVGDQIYARGRHGPYVYTFTPRTDPATAAQLNIRNTLPQIAALWHFMSPAEREPWETYAKNTPTINRIGRSCALSGWQRFVGTAVLRSIAGIFPPYNAPTVCTLARLQPPNYRPDLTGNNVRVRWALDDPWRFSTLGAVYMYQSLPQPLTVNHHTNPFVWYAYNTGHPITPPIFAIYALIHPATPAKPVVFLRIRAIDGDNRVAPANIQRVVWSI